MLRRRILDTKSENTPNDDTLSLDGRPKRKNIISEDDILNLVISLNTCESLEVFLREV